jgi:hypothetical protein
MTNVEEFELAVLCQTRADAKKFTDKVVAEMVCAGMYETKAREVLLESLGYMAGYYGEAERKKMEDLFDAVHPVFGRLRPHPEESLLLGFISARTDSKTARKVADLLQRRVEEGKR